VIDGVALGSLTRCYRRMARRIKRKLLARGSRLCLYGAAASAENNGGKKSRGYRYISLTSLQHHTSGMRMQACLLWRPSLPVYLLSLGETGLAGRQPVEEE